VKAGKTCPLDFKLDEDDTGVPFDSSLVGFTS